VKEYKPYRWINIDIDFSKQKLLNIFEKNKKDARIYYNQAEGKPQPITLLNPSSKDYCKELESKFRYVRDSYYLTSSGYNPHIDDRRQCIISFELKNDHQVPLKFYDPDEEVFHTTPIMWNTTVLHGSEPSPSERIFFQIELEDDKSFDFYAQKHLEGELII
tara:strand:- start:560 stop:1045 length:486 start_codon:yes stop_codon:yes gene_type:complete